jgi:hypothetical protein
MYVLQAVLAATAIGLLVVELEKVAMCAAPTVLV